MIAFQPEGKFGGWPANGGMWAWGNEILLCYTEADHQDRRGHTYDQSTARTRDRSNRNEGANEKNVWCKRSKTSEPNSLPGGQSR